MRLRGMRTGGLSFLAVLLSGCAAVEVEVTAYRAAALQAALGHEDATVAVVVAGPAEEPLLADEVAAKTMHLLDRAGHTVAALETADWVLACTIEMGTGRVVARSVPVSEPARTYRSYYYVPGAFGRRTRIIVRSDHGPSRTRYRTERYTVFTKVLRMELYRNEAPPNAVADSAEFDPGPLLWQGTATITGPSSDLRWLSNHLLLALFEHFKADTGRQISETIDWESRAVRDLADVANARGATDTSTTAPQSAGASTD
jgi:hypothetical protein